MIVYVLRTSMLDPRRWTSWKVQERSVRSSRLLNGETGLAVMRKIRPRLRARERSMVAELKSDRRRVNMATAPSQTHDSLESIGAWDEYRVPAP